MTYKRKTGCFKLSDFKNKSESNSLDGDTVFNVFGIVISCQPFYSQQVVLNS